MSVRQSSESKGNLTSGDGAQGEPVGRLCDLEPHRPRTVPMRLKETVNVYNTITLNSSCHILHFMM